MVNATRKTKNRGRPGNEARHLAHGTSLRRDREKSGTWNNTVRQSIVNGGSNHGRLINREAH